MIQYWNKKLYAKARSLYEDANIRWPNDVEILRCLGRSYLNAGQGYATSAQEEERTRQYAHKAIEVLEMALHVKPDDGELLQNCAKLLRCAEIYCHVTQEEKASTLLDRIVELESEDRWTLKHCARFYRQIRQHEKAIVLLKTLKT